MRFFILGILILVSTSLYAQKVIISKKGYISNEQTYEYVLNKLLAEAKTDACREAGVEENIYTFSSLSINENQDNINEVFTSDILTNMRGRIKEWKYINEPTQEFDKEIGRPYVTFSIEAIVEKYKSERDPTFKAEISGVKSSYKHDERIEFEINFLEDAYINIFYFSDREALRVFPIPNSQFKAQLYKKESSTEINHIQAEFNSSFEYGKILTVITKKNYPYINLENKDGYNIVTTWENIQKWMLNIEPNMRYEYFHEFVITKD